MTKKRVTLTEMDDLLKTAKHGITSSNDIIPRTQNPYYHSHPLVPPPLKEFKDKITTLRVRSSTLINQIGNLSIPKFNPAFSDTSFGSLAHIFIGSLVVASLGFGECGECSARVAAELILKGYNDLAFINIKFTNTKIGMENGHQIIIANLASSPERFRGQSIFDFFNHLPISTIISDAFLGLSFKPTDIPERFRAYINAYGGKAIFSGCTHVTNFSKEILMTYIITAGKIKQKMLTENKFSQHYDMSARVPINPTSLINLLNEKSPLTFFGVSDEKFVVDAVAELHHNDLLEADRLSQNLQYSGQFFMSDEKRFFVLQGINLPNGNISMGEHIQARLCGKF